MKQHDKVIMWTYKLDHDSQGSWKVFSEEFNCIFNIQHCANTPNKTGNCWQQGLHSESWVLVTGFCFLFSLKSICKVSRWCWWVTSPVPHTFLFKQTVGWGWGQVSLQTSWFYPAPNIGKPVFTGLTHYSQDNGDVETSLPRCCLCVIVCCIIKIVQNCTEGL